MVWALASFCLVALTAAWAVHWIRYRERGGPQVNARGRVLLHGIGHWHIPRPFGLAREVLFGRGEQGGKSWLPLPDAFPPAS